MVQGCWSVVPVCATSYSWKTGPHWGTMESPQTAAGTREPATPMVAVQAENGSTNLAGMRSPGIGPDGRLVQMSAKIPLRGCEPLGFRRWVANFKDCASKAKLNGLLQSRAVPTREAVVLSFPDQSEEQQQALYEDALRVYQIENTALFYMIAPSVDLRGDWELNDLTTVEESYQEGDLRDGLGFLTWVESFNDTTTEAGQIKALANFTKFKYPIDTTVLQLRKGLLDSLAVWGTITGNDKADRVKLDSFYKATRDKFAGQGRPQFGPREGGGNVWGTIK